MDIFIAIGIGLALGLLINSPMKLRILAVLFFIGALLTVYDGKIMDSVKVDSTLMDRVGMEHALEDLHNRQLAILLEASGDTKRQLAILGIVLSFLFLKIAELEGWKKQHQCFSKEVEKE